MRYGLFALLVLLIGMGCAVPEDVPVSVDDDTRGRLGTMVAADEAVWLIHTAEGTDLTAAVEAAGLSVVGEAGGFKMVSGSKTGFLAAAAAPGVESAGFFCGKDAATKFDSMLRMQMLGALAKEETSAMGATALLKGDATDEHRAMLEALGVTLGSAEGRVVAFEAPASVMGQVAGLDFVERIQATQELKPMDSAPGTSDEPVKMKQPGQVAPGASGGGAAKGKVRPH